MHRRLKSTHLDVMLANLDNLLAASKCNEQSTADPFAEGLPTHNISNLNGTPRSLEAKLVELLKPANVAFLRAELQTMHSYATKLAVGKPSRFSDRMLDISMLDCCCLEITPGCPPGLSPRMVSYHSSHMVAAREGNVEAMVETMSAASELQYSFTISSLTPIFFAIESGNVTAVRYLLDIGVGANDVFGRQNTIPLAAALQFRHPGIVELLLKVSDPRVSFQHRSLAGWSPMTYIWFKPQPNPPASDLLALLRSSPCFGYLHLDVYDDDGWSVMHRAAVYGAAEDIPILIEYGLDAFAKTIKPKPERDESEYDQFSVLQLAVHYGRLNVVEQLLPHYVARYGNVDLPDRRGWTLLHMAVDEGHLDVARMLVVNGANVDAKTKRTLSDTPGDDRTYKHTPTSLAKSYGPEVYKEFLVIYHSAKTGTCPHQSSKSITAPRSPGQHDTTSSTATTSNNPSLALLASRTYTTHDMQISLANGIAAHTPSSAIEARKSFEKTSVSGRARAQLGDVYNVRHYHYHIAPQRKKRIGPRKRRCRRLQRLYRQLSFLDHG